jgi:hypothetical protein
LTSVSHDDVEVPIAIQIAQSHGPRLIRTGARDRLALSVCIALLGGTFMYKKNGHL